MADLHQKFYISQICRYLTAADAKKVDDETISQDLRNLIGQIEMTATSSLAYFFCLGIDNPSRDLYTKFIAKNAVKEIRRLYASQLLDEDTDECWKRFCEGGVPLPSDTSAAKFLRWVREKIRILPEPVSEDEDKSLPKEESEKTTEKAPPERETKKKVCDFCGEDQYYTSLLPSIALLETKGSAYGSISLCKKHHRVYLDIVALIKARGFFEATFEFVKVSELKILDAFFNVENAQITTVKGVVKNEDVLISTDEFYQTYPSEGIVARLPRLTYQGH